MEATLVTLFINVFNLLKTNAKESISWLDEIRQERDFFGKAVKTYCENLKKRCDILKILNMEKPIELGQVYTSVNVLKKITANCIISDISLLEEQLRNHGYFGQVKETTSAIDL
ncbi:MAG: hypothetical protein HY819_10710 [Acidobacteria bacterium]|nr:hypothetical protein [Acidobacteriota bacterium]